MKIDYKMTSRKLHRYRYEVFKNDTYFKNSNDTHD